MTIPLDPAVPAAPEPEPEPAPEPAPSSESVPPTPILGTLPPPSTDEVVRPLAVAGDMLTEEDTECTADPDTVDEPTEEVAKEIKAQIDDQADDWDRMLGLDLKADDKLDKEWIRAARESEYQRFVVWGASGDLLRPTRSVEARCVRRWDSCDRDTGCSPGCDP